MDETSYRDIEQTVGNIRAEAANAARAARDEVGAGLRDAPYAALGALAAGAERAGRASRGAARLPGRVLERLEPRHLADAYRERAERGHALMDRLLGRRSVEEARRQVRAARAKARAAATSAVRAADATGRAVKDTADAATASADTRPYEARTREELYELAGERNLEGRSSMTKAELIAALRRT
jgi:hypothetical protein